MNAIAPIISGSQTMSPQDRIRAAIAMTVAHEIAERVLQHQKANPSYKLKDLRDDDERGVFLADVIELLSPARQRDRAIRLSALRKQGFALRENDGETALSQARKDIADFDRAAQFGTVRAGHCYRCKQLIADPVKGAVLFLTDNLKADVHCACIAEEIAVGKVERIGPFQFRVVDEGGQQ